MGVVTSVGNNGVDVVTFKPSTTNEQSYLQSEVVQVPNASHRQGFKMQNHQPTTKHHHKLEQHMLNISYDAAC